MDGWMDGGMDGWMDGRLYVCMHAACMFRLAALGCRKPGLMFSG